MTFKVINFYPEYGEVELSDMTSNITYNMMIPIIDGKYEIEDNLSIILNSDNHNIERANMAMSASNTGDLIALIDPNGLAYSVRLQRNKLLIASDYTQLSDVHITNATDWKTYRQALRDLPNQKGFPSTTSFPLIPK